MNLRHVVFDNIDVLLVNYKDEVNKCCVMYRSDIKLIQNFLDGIFL
jgi:hypothetical protein